MEFIPVKDGENSPEKNFEVERQVYQHIIDNYKNMVLSLKGEVEWLRRTLDEALKEREENGF